MTEDNEIRLVEALEGIAESLALWCKLQQDRYNKEYPVKPVPQDAKVTHIANAEDRIRASIGGNSNEPIDRWVSGIFEKEFEERERDKSKSPKGS